MIPTVQPGIPPCAHAAQSQPADAAEAPGFLAELTAQNDSAAAQPIDAEDCLIAGMMVAGQQTPMQSVRQVHFISADGRLTPAVEPGAQQPSSAPANVAVVEEATSADSDAVAEIRLPAETSVSPLDTPSPRLQHAEIHTALLGDATKSSPATQASEPARRVTESNSAPSIPTHSPHARARLGEDSMVETANAALQSAANRYRPVHAGINSTGQMQVLATAQTAPLDQPTLQPDTTADVPVPVSPLSAQQSQMPPASQQSAVAKVAALQTILPPSPATEVPGFAQPLLVQRMAEQPITNETPSANLGLPISAAESAWQTLLHRDAPQVPQNGPGQLQQQATSLRPDTVMAHILPQMTKADIPPNTAPQSSNQPSTTEKGVTPFPDPVSAPLRDHSITAANAIVSLPQQLGPDIHAQVAKVAQAKPDQIAAPTAISYQAAQITQQPPVSTQLLHHSSGAKTGGVDVLLQPEELGHVKFQIQQHGDNVRILLSAERPDTADFLRRHADQLLQEFRQSGFTQASVSFGQWGDQQRPSNGPQNTFDQAEIAPDDPPPSPRPEPIASNLAAAGGLDLRL